MRLDVKRLDPVFENEAVERDFIEQDLTDSIRRLGYHEQDSSWAVLLVLGEHVGFWIAWNWELSSDEICSLR